jgi:DNA-binding beta-propeller fold protein YncE
MTVDVAGNLYIADLVDNRIRKVTAGTGIITTVAGTGTQCSPKTDPCGDNGPATSAKFSNPAGVAIDSAGNLYIATVDGRIRKVTAATGIITTIAGNGIVCSSTTATCGDGGAAINANMGTIYGVALDSTGNVYIADNSDFRIRKLTVATGIITTVAGTGNACTRTTACGDGGPATSATLGLTP